MRRALLVSTGTVAGLAAVLALNPSADPGAGGDPVDDAVAVTAPEPTGTDGAAAGGTDGATSADTAGPADGSYDGQTIQTRWGPVQVQAVVSGGALTDVIALQLPDGDMRSYQISVSAEPVLREQALAAQSAAIDGVSGATYTSDGYARSLASALAQAGL